MIGKENTLEENAYVIRLFHIVILSVWTWSFCKFTFVLTTVKKLPKSIETNKKVVLQQHENNIVDPSIRSNKTLMRSKCQVTENNKNQKKTKDTKNLNNSNAIRKIVAESEIASVSDNVQDDIIVEDGKNATNKSEEQIKNSKTSFRNVVNVRKDIDRNYFNCFCFLQFDLGINFE